jgi:hypothetical protein
MGRVGFPTYASRNIYQVLFDDWHTTGIGGVLMGMGNDNLTWDKQNSLNIGFDLSLWRRLNLTFSWYDKRTKNMVTDITIPSSAGFTSYVENMGEVSNKGYEFNVNYSLLQQKEWNVNVSLTGSHNKNTILKISDALKAYNDRVDRYYEAYQSNSSMGNAKRDFVKPIRKYVEGGSEYAIFGMKSLGISPSNGRELFLNRDGTPTYDWNSAEQVIIGNTEPDLQGSFSLNVRYKGFSLYSTFLYEYGGDAYNETLVRSVESVEILQMNVDRRVSTMRWKKPGDIAPLKSINDPYRVTRSTSRFVQRDNTLTFNSLSLAYTVEPRVVKKIGLSMLQLRLSMNEVAVFSTIKQERGTSYPFARTFGFSLNTTF